MSYFEEMDTVTCPTCKVTNHRVIAHAGDGRANEREESNCYACGGSLESVKCFAVFSGETADQAKAKLRRMQNKV